MKHALKLHNLHVSVEGKTIVKGVTLSLHAGEVHALMGPNGSGKSTLALAIMGHPKCTITSGHIILNGEDITALPPYERARRGLFLSMQYPPEISGVTISQFLRAALNASRETPLSVLECNKLLREKADALGLDRAFLGRSINEGFSGGEKKRAEILQLMALEPSFAILDETDSGLDVDALKTVAAGINQFHSNERGILIITHYSRILQYVKPDKVHVMQDGCIVKSGGAELAKEIEARGYSYNEKRGSSM